MSCRLFYLYCAALLLTNFGQSAQILKISDNLRHLQVTHDDENDWLIGDRACVHVKKDHPIACGEITQVEDNHAILSIEQFEVEIQSEPNLVGSTAEESVEVRFHQTPLKKGQQIIRELTSVSDELPPIILKRESAQDYKKLLEGEVYPLSAITAGLNYLFPFVHFQGALTPHFSIGVHGTHMLHSAGTGEVHGFGALLTFNHFSRAPFTGFWISYALGGYDLRVKQGSSTIKTFTPTIQATLGWRWRWKSGLNFGAALGGMGMYPIASNEITVDVPYVLPSLSFDIGYSF